MDAKFKFRGDRRRCTYVNMRSLTPVEWKFRREFASAELKAAWNAWCARGCPDEIAAQQVNQDARC